MLEKFNYNKPTRCAFLYPNTYEVGMSNLGLHILYKLLNELPAVGCERFFLPDSKELALYRKANTGLYSIETCRKLSDFHILCVTVSFEGDYFNLLTMLELGKIPLRAAQRNEHHPLVIIGGPCATFNPLPLSPVADAFIIGEGEQSLISAVNFIVANGGLSRSEQLELLAQIPGVYVPLVNNRPQRQWITELDQYPNYSAILTDKTEFGKMLIVEISRGCGRGCRFCMAGYAFRYPRHRCKENLLAIISKYAPIADKVGLMGPAVSDYPEILPLAEQILDLGLDFSVASLRADSLTPRLTEKLAQSGQRTLTIAPEAGSQRLRNIINKGINAADIMKSVELLSTAKIPHLKLYIMLGLPFETSTDIQELIDLVLAIRRRMDEINSHGNLILSINTFVPKPSTPFQWLPLADKKYIENTFKDLTAAFKHHKKIEIHMESYKESVLQALLAKGDALIGEFMVRAAEQGGSKALLPLLKAAKIDIADYIYTTAQEDTVFPWDIIDMGFEKKYLRQELQKAGKEQTTSDCRTGCRRCGVCSDTAQV